MPREALYIVILECKTVPNLNLDLAKCKNNEKCTLQQEKKRFSVAKLKSVSIKLDQKYVHLFELE